MGTKVALVKFGPQDKSRVKGKVKHSRTGACTARGKCYHGSLKVSRSSKLTK